jgi:hypothetical protein
MTTQYLRPATRQYPVWNSEHARWNTTAQRWATKAVRNCTDMRQISDALKEAGASVAKYNFQRRCTEVFGKHSASTLWFGYRNGKIVCTEAWVAMEQPGCH